MRDVTAGFLPRDGYRVMSPADIEAELLSAEDGVWRADDEGYDLVIDCTGNLRVFQQVCLPPSFESPPLQPLHKLPACLESLPLI